MTAAISIELTDVAVGPFAQSEAHYKAGRVVWVEVTEEFVDYCLGVLPPIYGKGGGFMVSEPYDHTETGEPVYTGCSRNGYRGKWYATTVARSRFEGAVEALKCMSNGGLV